MYYRVPGLATRGACWLATALMCCTGLLTSSAPIEAQGTESTTIQGTESVTVTADNVELVVEGSRVKAGDLFSFTIKLDRAPNFPGGSVQYVITGPGHARSAGNCAAVSEYRLTYNCEFRVPATGPSGTWRIKSANFVVGNKKVKLIDRPTTFQVLPNPGVILPTKAEVVLNGSQTDLLRREADRISDKIQLLKVAVSYYDKANNKKQLAPVLLQYLNSETDELSKTEAEFVRMSTGEVQKMNASIFFGDLRSNYQEAIHSVQTNSAERRTPEGYLIAVADGAQGGISSPLLSVTLCPLENNELAYSVVADSESLTFDLEVDSDPPGATVSYHRRGDEPRVNPDPTNSTIRSLPYAIWVVDFKKAGFPSIEREHDPFRESNHVIHIEFRQ